MNDPWYAQALNLKVTLLCQQVTDLLGIFRFVNFLACGRNALKHT